MKKRIPLFCKVMEYVKFNESLEHYAHSIFIIKSILTSMKARCYPSRSDVLISSEMWYFDINRRINIEYQSINQSIIFTKMRIIYFFKQDFRIFIKNETCNVWSTWFKLLFSQRLFEYPLVFFSIGKCFNQRYSYGLANIDYFQWIKSERCKKKITSVLLYQR